MVRIFRLMLVLLYIYINSTNIPPIMIINRIYEHQNLLHVFTVHQQYQGTFLLFQTDAHNYKIIGILKN